MWPNPQFPADLVTITEEILNGKLDFLCSDKALCFKKNLLSTKVSKESKDLKTLKKFRNKIIFIIFYFLHVYTIGIY